MSVIKTLIGFGATGPRALASTVNSLYCRHPWDQELAFARDLVVVHIIGMSVIVRCPQGES